MSIVTSMVIMESFESEFQSLDGIRKLRFFAKCSCMRLFKGIYSETLALARVCLCPET